MKPMIGRVREDGTVVFPCPCGEPRKGEMWLVEMKGQVFSVHRTCVRTSPPQEAPDE